MASLFVNRWSNQTDYGSDLSAFLEQILEIVVMTRAENGSHSPFVYKCAAIYLKWFVASIWLFHAKLWLQVQQCKPASFILWLCSPMTPYILAKYGKCKHNKDRRERALPVQKYQRSCWMFL